MEKTGTLVILGDDVTQGEARSILTRFVDLAGGPDARVVLLACESEPAVQQAVEAALLQGGLRQACLLPLATRQDANDHRNAARILNASGILVIAGENAQLNRVLGGSDVAGALHEAYRRRAVIAGCGAGGRALSKTMLAAPVAPAGGLAMPGLAAGLGFLNGVVVETGLGRPARMGCLQAIVAANPGLLGVGIDAQAALVVQPGRSLEVLGCGGVTLLDPRKVTGSHVDAIERLEDLAVPGMVVEHLASGFHYTIARPGSEAGSLLVRALLKGAAEVLA